MLSWFLGKGEFPTLLLLRRYLKIVARYCEDQGLLEMDFLELDNAKMPFDLQLLPTVFPPLDELKLWEYPEESASPVPNPPND